MYSFKITREPYVGRLLKIPYYLKTNHGVEILITHDLHRNNIKYRWVQTVLENGEIAKRCHRSIHMDPYSPTGKKDPATGREICKASNKTPFYYSSKKELMGNHRRFYDSPQERAPKSGRLWLRFCTSLVEFNEKDKAIGILITIYWGYDRYPDGRIRIVMLRLATKKEQEKHIFEARGSFPSYKFSV